MNIDDMTVGQLREVAKLARGLGSDCTASGPTACGEAVIVRAYSGVFFGYLVAKAGASVELRDVRQIWSWDSSGLPQKSHTCADIAARGVGTGSKISEPAARAFVEQVGAVFFMTKDAEQIVKAQKWATK